LRHFSPLSHTGQAPPQHAAGLQAQPINYAKNIVQEAFMFNRIFYGLRTAATLGATAAALVACGGGEDLALNPPGDQAPSGCTASSDCAVSPKTATAFQYGAGTAAGAVATHANDYTISGTRTDATETWGAVVGQLNLNAAQDVSGYKSLKLSLASSSNSEVTLMLVSSKAAKDKACYPSYVATGLSDTAKNFTIALTDFKLASNPDKANCAPGKTTDPDTPDALKDVTAIQFREIKGTAGKNAVNVVVGKPLLWSMDEPVTQTPPPACSSISGGNVPVCTTGAFQYGTGAAAGAVATNANDYTITGTRTGATEAWGAVVGQLNLYAAQDVSSYKSLKLSLASSSNSEVMLMLMSSGAANECYPTYKTTGLSATPKNFTILLSDFKLTNNPDQGKCAPGKTTDPDTAAALTKVTGLQVREIKGDAGKNTVNVVVGKPLLWSGDLPVVPPTLTPVEVDYGYHVAFEGIANGATSFTKTGSIWMLSSTRSDAANAWSTAIGVLHVNAQPTGTLAKNSLGFTLTSGGNRELLIRLKASNYVDPACTPTFKATGLSTTAKAFTVALSDFKSSNDITASCAAQTATALDLTNFDKIEITDRKESTGTTTISVTLTDLNWVLAP
jgi:hypothetical protein